MLHTSSIEKTPHDLWSCGAAGQHGDFQHCEAGATRARLSGVGRKKGTAAKRYLEEGTLALRSAPLRRQGSGDAETGDAETGKPGSYRLVAGVLTLSASAESSSHATTRNATNKLTRRR